MWIVSQNRKSVANLDNTLGLALNDTVIVAKFHDNTRSVVLGQYEEERAQEVFADMLGELFPDNIPSSIVYWMPE